MKMTHCFVNIFHVSYERLNILRCVFTVLFSQSLLPKNERKKISAANSALLVYSFSRHECQCGCNKVCLWIQLLFVFTIMGEDLKKKKRKKRRHQTMLYGRCTFNCHLHFLYFGFEMNRWCHVKYEPILCNNDITSKRLVSKTFNCCLFCYIIK